MRSPCSITVRLAFAGGASLRGSAPVRCAVAARTQPPWVTTITSSPRSSSTAAATRAWSCCERLGVGWRELAAPPGGDVVGIELVERVAGPVADVDLAPARVGAARRRARAASAVCTARVRSEDSRRAGIPSRNGSSAAACSRPSWESGGSAWPCSRCSAFQVDSPWRTSRRRWVTADSMAAHLEQLVRTPLRRGGQVERGARPTRAGAVAAAAARRATRACGCGPRGSTAPASGAGRPA